MFLETDKIWLFQVEEADLPVLRDWRNDPELRKMMREYTPLNMFSQKKWLESLQDDKRNIMFLIREKERESPIGVCGLVHVDWKNRCAETSLYIGEKNFTENIYYRHVIYLLCDYAFRELGFHRLWSEIYLIDDGWVDMYKSWGFKVDGESRDTYWWDGKWWASAFVSMLDNEWEDMRDSYVP
jgi:RimJ/RimL family protein N-acetyltransferase